MGLFERYPADPDAIVERADELLIGGGRLETLMTGVERSHRTALAGVDGVLEVPLESAPADALVRMERITLVAQYASACMVDWADAIETFNRSTDDLNARWEAMLATVAAAARTAKTDIQAGAVEATTADRVFEGVLADRDALLQELRRERQRLEAELDARAAHVGKMLDAGPNAQAIRYLRGEGFLPPKHGLNPAYVKAIDLLGCGLEEATPDQIAAWWASLTLVQRRAVLTTDTDTIGNLDGIPAEVRDQANRARLVQMLADAADEEGNELLEENLATIVRALQDAEAAANGEPVQLYIFDPEAFDNDGRVAISIGDMDLAEHVAIMVPGLGTSVASMTMDRAINVYQAAIKRTDDKVAVLNWVGYDAPDGHGETEQDYLSHLDGDDLASVLNRDAATAGADLLAEDVAGIQAMRRDDDPHLTVAGNSYGSTTAAISADHDGLDADDLILTGSPGAGDADNADDLTTGNDHTWVGSASHDWITSLGVTGWIDPSSVHSQLLPKVDMMGNDPAEDTFDARRFTAEHPDRGEGWTITDHTRYYDADGESLENVTSIVIGDYDAVERADHRYDPLADPDVHKPGIDAGLDPLLDTPFGDFGPEWRPAVDVDLGVSVETAPQDPERDREPAADN